MAPFRLFGTRLVLGLVVGSICSSFLAAQSRLGESVHFDGDYWGIWGPDSTCRFRLSPTSDGGFQGIAIPRRDGVDVEPVTRMTLKPSGEGTWTLQWPSSPVESGVSDNLKLFETTTGPCLAGDYSVTDPVHGDIRSIALIWLDADLEQHPSESPGATDLEIVDGPPVTTKVHTATDGLASNATRSIARDGRRGIWVGTIEGLSYFDGYDWTTYDPFSEPALPDENVTSLLSRSGGELVIATKGDGIYYLREGRFEPAPWNAEIEGLWPTGLTEGADRDFGFRIQDGRELCHVDSEGALTVFSNEDWTLLRVGVGAAVIRGWASSVDAVGNLVAGASAGVRIVSPDRSSPIRLARLRVGNMSIFPTRAPGFLEVSDHRLTWLDPELRPGSTYRIPLIDEALEPSSRDTGARMPRAARGQQ